MIATMQPAQAKRFTAQCPHRGCDWHRATIYQDIAGIVLQQHSKSEHRSTMTYDQAAKHVKPIVEVKG